MISSVKKNNSIYVLLHNSRNEPHICFVVFEFYHWTKVFVFWSILNWSANYWNFKLSIYYYANFMTLVLFYQFKNLGDANMQYYPTEL